MIVVVNRAGPGALQLKELIEFMDSPSVCIAAPEEWKDRLEGQRLEALFVASDLSDADVDAVLHSVREHDPNVPIVMLKGVAE